MKEGENLHIAITKKRRGLDKLRIGYIPQMTTSESNNFIEYLKNQNLEEIYDGISTYIKYEEYPSIVFLNVTPDKSIDIKTRRKMFHDIKSRIKEYDGFNVKIEDAYYSYDLPHSIEPFIFRGRDGKVIRHA